MAEGKITLKLVKGERYMSRLFGAGVVVQRGEKVTVDADKAAPLLEDKYTDALGNEHFYFEEVDGDGEDNKPAGRTRRAKAAPAAGEGEGEGDK